MPLIIVQKAALCKNASYGIHGVDAHACTEIDNVTELCPETIRTWRNEWKHGSHFKSAWHACMHACVLRWAVLLLLRAATAGCGRVRSTLSWAEFSQGGFKGLDNTGERRACHVVCGPAFSQQRTQLLHACITFNTCPATTAT